MTPVGKDHIARPPKKRPLALFNYLLETSRGGEDDENLQPEDLSMKSSRRPTTPPPPPPRPVTPSSPRPAPSLMTPTPLLPAASAAPSLTPRRPAVTTLLGLVGSGLGMASTLPHTPSISDSTIESSSRPTYSSNSNNNSNSSGAITSSSFSGNTLSPSGGSGSSFMSSAGLRLISEVAAACGRPTVLRPPGSSSGTHSSPYAPPTPRDPLRHVLRERGVGVRPWHYHPYLPLGVYGLPSPLQATHASTPVHESASPTSRPRGGSVSPPGEAGSSSSESSPEVQQEGRGPRLTCPDCGRRYATMAGLAKHRQFHCLKDAGRSFACKHCEKVYTSLGALKMHIRTHTLPCKCQLCGKAFSRPWLLQGHIRTHTGEKPFQCPQCDRCFADRSNLRAHLQTHTDVKKYACRTCPKTFSRTSLLVKHEDHGCPGLRPARPMALAPAASLPI